MVNLPFIESELSEGFSWRTFSADTDIDDLQWHWDEEDRTVYFVCFNDWKFQFDNELPIDCERFIFIPKGTWHRIIKGRGDLTILVKKHI